jgi:hypothetical protein
MKNVFFYPEYSRVISKISHKQLNCKFVSKSIKMSDLSTVAF